MTGDADQPQGEFEPEPFEANWHDDSPDRDELLDSLLEQTQNQLNSDGVLKKLVDFVRAERLPSKFSMENLSELVRFILSADRFKNLPIESEDCVTWVSNCIYDDPVANERASVLWGQIIDELQANQ